MELSDMLVRGAEHYGISLSGQQVDQFMIYKELLKEWNKKINLTAITEDNEIITKHFIDSLSIVRSNTIRNGISLVDVGTGAGFPGIPIKIAFQNIDVTLLDSLNKRVSFLSTVINDLGLKNITAVHGRAEELSRTDKYRQKFDIATARAVANMRVLSEYCLPYVKKGGFFIAMKGPSGYEELTESDKTITALGGKCKEVIETKILEEEIKHNIIVVEKVNLTPDKYPRRHSIIEKSSI